MDNSGEVAERIVKLSVDGAVVALKVTGNGTKHLIILLHAILNDQNKTKGKIKLASMLKSGKELKVFTLSESDLKKFSQEAKRYGVTYCALRDRNVGKGHPIEIMVKAEDASKISRIFERLDFGKVDTIGIETEIEKALEDTAKNPPERILTAEKENIDNEVPMRKDGEQTANPFIEKTVESLPSEGTSKRQETEGKALNNKKKSVKKEIENIKRERIIKDEKNPSMADREKELRGFFPTPLPEEKGKSPKGREAR